MTKKVCHSRGGMVLGSMIRQKGYIILYHHPTSEPVHLILYHHHHLILYHRPTMLTPTVSIYSNRWYAVVLKPLVQI